MVQRRDGQPRLFEKIAIGESVFFGAEGLVNQHAFGMREGVHRIGDPGALRRLL